MLWYFLEWSITVNVTVFAIILCLHVCLVLLLILSFLIHKEKKFVDLPWGQLKIQRQWLWLLGSL